ncbi:hypothetical protein Daesc_002455 [Daldinia eschscholtzii]|uniref:Uncharacterized protein n=1 Tax=Daldinia eschscholtzii TaxID=292717 RepID=A0AAX6MX31_9PEZI
MQTVPSLIGAGTAVAAAATGLAFGELADEPLLRPNTSKRRSMIADRDFLSVFSSRPGTTNSTIPTTSNNDFLQDSTQQHSQPSTTSRPRNPRESSHSQIIHTKSLLARHPSTRQGEFAPATPIVEDSRDSLSSNGSWIRRLSIRPLSHHGSFRSSVGPDSPSITFSHGSAAPILSPVGHPPPQPPRNKLVKRASAANGGNTGLLVRRGSKTQMTLRRPATSHQRSATLNQQINSEAVQPLPDITLEQSNRPRAQTLTSSVEPSFGANNRPSRWKSFWHSRISRSPVKLSPLRGNDGAGVPGIKRVSVQQQSRRQVYLVVPGSLTMGSSTLEVPTGDLPVSENQSNTDSSPQPSIQSSDSSEGTPAKQPRRSISMHFSSTPPWIPKTGSIKRRKRGETVSETKRHVSAPATTGADTTTTHDMSNQQGFNRAETELSITLHPTTRKRNSSSPLPPITRLSSFHIDLTKLGSLSPGLQTKFNESTPNTVITPRTVSNTSQARTLDRASTTGSSEYYRGFTSGDDDDTDFKTDTPFDSIRTAASGCQRAADSPLESMFEESPPSTTGHNSKPKRLSIQDILGPSFDGGNKIMEEDEGIATPVRGAYGGAELRFLARDLENGDGFDSVPASPNFTTRGDNPRFSLDDDDDLDWDKEDDDGIYNHLSPPSSMNSRKGSPNSRPPLTNINGNARTTARTNSTNERPRSTVFDWTESMTHEKYDGNGSYMRPKTVHGKQEIDMRGGRSASRKGPIPAHVRSQSVPIVPELFETATSTPKFGTWGLGQKNASEDWDDDFEFEEEDVDGLFAGKNEESKVSMVVPASIQATQPTIKAHSGQIRELSLLVNDLKRLCRLGREMDMLGGSSIKLWREAEGIIALASPDEDPAEVSDSKSDSSGTPAQLVDQDFDSASRGSGELVRVTESQRNAVVRDRTAGRRRSVFSPEDDIFGTWDHTDESAPDRPKTPENRAVSPEFGSTSVARSVMESMQPRHSRVNAGRESSGKLNFDTNSLKELVKRASDLRDGLSDLVRKADHLTQSPARTPKHTRSDGSPAFTRVFDDPTSSPTRRIPHSQSSTSILSSGSVGASPSNGLNQRMQMMTVS